jgi:site-specific DNA recombinase
VEVHPDRAGVPWSKAAGEPRLVSLPVPLIRRSGETRLATPPDQATSGERNPAPVKLLVKAHMARKALASAGECNIRKLAEEQRHSKDYFGVLLRICRTNLSLA